MKQDKVVHIRFKFFVVICSFIMVLVIIGGGFYIWKTQDNKKKAELTELQNSFVQQVGATTENVQFGKQPDIYWATFTQDNNNYLLEYIGGVWKIVVKAPITPTPTLTPVPTTEPTP